MQGGCTRSCVERMKGNKNDRQVDKPFYLLHYIFDDLYIYIYIYIYIYFYLLEKNYIQWLLMKWEAHWKILIAKTDTSEWQTDVDCIHEYLEIAIYPCSYGLHRNTNAWFRLNISVTEFCLIYILLCPVSWLPPALSRVAFHYISLREKKNRCFPIPFFASTAHDIDNTSRLHLSETGGSYIYLFNW